MFIRTERLRAVARSRLSTGAPPTPLSAIAGVLAIHALDVTVGNGVSRLADTTDAIEQRFEDERLTSDERRIAVDRDRVEALRAHLRIGSRRVAERRSPPGCRCRRSLGRT